MNDRHNEIMRHIKKHKYASTVTLSAALGLRIDQVHMTMTRLKNAGVVKAYKAVNHHKENLYTELSREELEKIVPPLVTPLREAILEALSDGIPRTAKQVAACLGVSRKVAGDRMRGMVENTQIWRVDGNETREHYFCKNIFTVADIPEQPPEVVKVAIPEPVRSEFQLLRNEKIRAKLATMPKKVDVGPAVVETVENGSRKITFADNWRPHREGIQRSTVYSGYQSSMNGIY